MKITLRKPVLNPAGEYEMATVDEEVKLADSAVLSIDGSTSNSGLAILREKDGALLYCAAVERESKETPVRYKIQLKKFVTNILRNNHLLTTIYYEEPCIGYASAVSNLMMLRTFIEELIIENEPEFDHIEHFEINNKRWKKLFLAPDAVPNGTELEKKAVRKKLESYLPLLKVVTQDEIDAIAMGFASVMYMKAGHTAEELESKKKPHKFQYNIKFIGADDDESAFEEFSDVYKGPKSLLENGIMFTDIPKRGKFDDHVYKAMGSDDKVLIVKFSSDSHGNVILENRIGHLAEVYDYIYGVIWRKSRK